MKNEKKLCQRKNKDGEDSNNNSSIENKSNEEIEKIIAKFNIFLMLNAFAFFLGISEIF
jgi:hypothetical protein